MPDEAKHVLLRDDLDPAFDEAAVLAEVEDMARGGEWRDHIPYSVARQYRERPGLSARYASHVDGCSYCQRLIEALNPVVEGAGRAAKARESVVVGPTEAKSRGMAAAWLLRQWQVVPAGAALLLVGIIGGWGGTTMLGTEAESQTRANTEVAAVPDVLETDRWRGSIASVGEDLALVDVDGNLVGLFVVELDSSSASSLQGELAQLQGQEQRTDEEKFRMVRLLAQLGHHDNARISLHAAFGEWGEGHLVNALELLLHDEREQSHAYP